MNLSVVGISGGTEALEKDANCSAREKERNLIVPEWEEGGWNKEKETGGG